MADIDELYHRFLVRRDIAGALDLMCGWLNAHSAAMLEMRGERAHLLATQNIAIEAIEAYSSELGRHDPLLPAAIARPNDTVLTLRTECDWSRIRNSDYWEIILKPADIGDTLTVKAPTNSGSVGLSLYRDETRPFTREEIKMMQLMQPHLTRCARLFRDEVSNRRARCETYMLTDKEIAIVECLFAGHGYDEVCEIVHITKNTLKWHMRNIFQKTQVETLAHLILKLR